MAAMTLEHNVYLVGRSLAEWREILAYAAEAGNRDAARWYDVPAGAIAAMQAGKEELVG